MKKRVESNIAQQTIKKLSIRIIPYIFILYIVAYLDRVNIGFAALNMSEDLSLTSSALGLLAGIFFLGYFLFEVPSNVLLNRVGANKWLARIMVSWGIVVIMAGWAQSVSQLYILRFLLGVAEAGFFPGVILYLTFWFPAKIQGRIFALFITAMPVSNIIGAPLSMWILDNIHWAGMESWRWMFILEGIPAVILGIVTYFYLTDRPENAKWLTKEERDWLVAEKKQETALKVGAKNHNMVDAFKNTKVWRLAFIYFTLSTGMYGISFWMPSIIKGLSSSLSNTEIGLVMMVPFIFGAFAMVLWGRRSDRLRERLYHTALPPLLGAAGLIGCGLTNDPILSIVFMSLTAIGILSFTGPFWSMPALFLSGSAAAAGIAFINSLGNLGGFLGPYSLGFIKDITGNDQLGLFFLGLMLIISSMLTFGFRKEKIEVIASGDDIEDKVSKV